MHSGIETAVPPAHRHAVKFYATEPSLVSTVAGFIAEGMNAGQPAMVIATAPHREALAIELTARHVDVVQSGRRGDLVMLDARDTLELFMLEGEPSADLFATYVGSLLDQMLRGRGRTIVRVYGEMVDVLWRDGHAESAIKLEILWNRLAQKHGFALLCAYSMGNFYKRTDQYAEICGHHSHVFDEAMPAVGVL